MPCWSVHLPAGIASPDSMGILGALDFVHRGYLLAGVVGAAIPILIHLLTRDRVKRVAFSTIRFFLKANKRILRRRKFQEMILLAMRAVACALLAVAFARPFVKAAEAQPPGTLKAAIARVIVADVSASMARAGIEAQLRKEAEAAVKSLSGGTDAAALITFADSPSIDVPLSTDLAEIRSKVGAIAPGHGGTNIPEALRRADAVLRQAGAKVKEIVLISDLQRAGWRYFKGDWKLSGDVKLEIRPVASSDTRGNVAVVEADFPQSMVMDRSARVVSARIANFSAADRRDVDVSLLVGGKKADTRKANLRAGGNTVVSFRHVFDSPGDNPCAVVIDLDDAAAADNALYFNARVIPRMKVVILNGSPSVNPLTDAAAFVETALAPSADSPFQTATVPSSSAAAKDLDDALVVILANVGSVNAAVAQALSGVLQRGGGILFLPGDAVSADGFNRVFGEIAPCNLRRIVTAQTARGEPGEAVLAKVDFEHPIFEVFLHPHCGDLSTPKFTRFWEVTDSQLARVLARFSDGRPAVLERQVAGGISMMLACPVDLRWNDLPQRAIFLPYLHQTARYLAIRSEKRTAYQVGDRLPVQDGRALKDPQGRTRSSGDLIAAEPGFYVMADKDGTGEFTFAVNRSPAEADPATIAAEEIAAAVERAPGELVPGGDAAQSPLPSAERDDNNTWWYIFLGVTLLLIGELFVGNRTMRH